MAEAKQFRVWHIPQVPGKPFHVRVKNEYEAEDIIRTLWDYDQFQYSNRIKPDYANASGLEVLVDGEWQEWEDEDGNSIEDCVRATGSEAA